MKCNIEIFLFLAFAMFTAGCVSNNIPEKKYVRLQKLDWLTGSWQDTSVAMQLTESWEKINDSTYKGNGFGVEKGDTIFIEKLSLISRNNKILYIATVNEHLDGKPVAFELVSDSAQKWIFENPKHDFPQRIIYMHPSENALFARVEGMVNGKLQGEEFNMQRVK
jgi:hypothetical protein